MAVDNIGSIGAVVGGGFFGGLLLGYAIKKVIRLIAVVIGLFLAGLAYVQYQQLASVNWDKVESTITANLGVPLTGGMSASFAIGFMKG